jgi:CRISPR-associated protein Csm3
MASNRKLVKHVCVNAKLVCKTGLHIGGTEAGMGIGSAEGPVIKDARGVPYIPGSSLKGKMRSMLEYKYKRGEDGSPCGCGLDLNTCPVCTIFGPHKSKVRPELGPTRIIVRDASLSAKSLKDWETARSEGKDFTTTKTETMIDRNTGMAYRGSLRTQERVNAGTEFQLSITLRIFEGDNEARITGLVKEGIDLINKDYLGGSGTRGYGWVEVTDIEVKDI